jgi:hypothetical protein
MAYVMEDGSVSGEVLTRTKGRFLPKDFSVKDPEALFDIPHEFRGRQLQVSPHHEEIIVAFVDPAGHHLCSFLMSDLPDDHRLRSALAELAARIQAFAEPGASPNGGLAEPLGNSGVSGGPPSVS